MQLHPVSNAGHTFPPLQVLNIFPKGLHLGIIHPDLLQILFCCHSSTFLLPGSGQP
jgi:hypothetical protein